MSILNERIKDRRQSIGLTLLQIAEELGVKEATVQRYESGEIKNIKHETIVQLASILNCSPAYLMGWEDKPQEQFQINKEEQDHLHKYRSIDTKGKHTVDTVLEMEYIRCNKPHLTVNAAHAIEGASEEDKQHDEDIMKNF